MKMQRPVTHATTQCERYMHEYVCHLGLLSKATRIVTTLANNKYFGQCPCTFFDVDIAGVDGQNVWINDTMVLWQVPLP